MNCSDHTEEKLRQDNNCFLPCLYIVDANCHFSKTIFASRDLNQEPKTEHQAAKPNHTRTTCRVCQVRLSARPGNSVLSFFRCHLSAHVSICLKRFCLAQNSRNPSDRKKQQVLLTARDVLPTESTQTFLISVKTVHFAPSNALIIGRAL